MSKGGTQMFKNKTAILAPGTALALLLGGTLALAADTSTSPTPPSTTTTDTNPNSNGKTSDRTPGDPAPDRTPNASSTGAAGTDVGKTTEGTSDRTPSNDSK
jgi:hypothetical protein